MGVAKQYCGRLGKVDNTVWLIVRRSLDKDPTYSYFISNAPMSSRLPLFVWLSGLRWAIEQCFEETKTDLGLDHYEVRKYRGWHHHMLTCMHAHFFLWHLKISSYPNYRFFVASTHDRIVLIRD